MLKTKATRVIPPKISPRYAPQRPKMTDAASVFRLSGVTFDLVPSGTPVSPYVAFTAAPRSVFAQ